MTVILALENLFAGVKAQFAADGINVPNLFGWQIPAQHMQQLTRIAWVPGDPTSNAGNTLPARNPGQIPRSLAVLDELFTVYITGQDPSDPENEQKQYHIARIVRDQWYRAVYLKAHGTFSVRSETWLIGKISGKTERHWGASLRLVCAIQSPVLDAINGDSGITDAMQDALDDSTTLGADIDVELILTEGITIPPGDVPPIGGGDGEAGGPGTHVQSQSNKNMPARVTVSDGDLACDIAVQSAPEFDAFVNVAVNGVMITSIGNGSKIGFAAYFSNDGGSTARVWNAIDVGDTLHWNASVAGYQLSASDLIDFWYEETGGGP